MSNKYFERYKMRKLISEHEDLWSRLLNADKPILLYGMGDGADKVLDVCNAKGINVNGVFASDGFAKKKIFRGFEVTTFSEALVKHSNPIVLLSFASSLDSVLDNVKRIAADYELYCPDVPVFGGGLFDRSFVLDNINEFESVYSLLSDEKSKSNYVNLVLGKMTGCIDYLLKAETDVSEAYKYIIKPTSDSHYVDIGAYNGDTIREYLTFSGGYRKITAFEPDAKNYQKLCSYAIDSGIPIDTLYNIAAWNKKETLTFYSRSGRSSSGTTSHKNVKCVEIHADAVDNYIDSKVDFINIDAEGSDSNVIDGLSCTVAKYKPCISCALYHRNEDMFAIPLKLHRMYGNCSMYIRHFRYLPAWDTNVYVKI